MEGYVELDGAGWSCTELWGAMRSYEELWGAMGSYADTSTQASLFVSCGHAFPFYCSTNWKPASYALLFLDALEPGMV